MSCDGPASSAAGGRAAPPLSRAAPPRGQLWAITARGAPCRRCRLSRYRCRRYARNAGRRGAAGCAGGAGGFKVVSRAPPTPCSRHAAARTRPPRPQPASLARGGALCGAKTTQPGGGGIVVAMVTVQQDCWRARVA